jgi:hypothetical protein
MRINKFKIIVVTKQKILVSTYIQRAISEIGIFHFIYSGHVVHKNLSLQKYTFKYVLGKPIHEN